ncbi:MAG: hypothetical protein ACOX6A_04175 [Atribacter sp.]|uniref:hypothetical protein n=1 Tax=Atribacter sp. TaxID=2847780 RepID=UPI003D955B7B
MTTRIIVFFLLFSTVFNFHLAGAETNDMERIRTLIVGAATKAESIGCRNIDILADNYKGMRSSPKFSELQDLEADLVHFWREALANMGRLAHSDMEKALLLYSCGGLSSKDYIDLLQESLVLVKNGDLDREIFYDIQTPFNETSDAWAVLIKNPENPAVREIIKSSKKIFHDMPERISSYDRILSGKSFRELEKFETGMRDEVVLNSNPTLDTRNSTTVVQEVFPERDETIKKRWVKLPMIIGVFVGLIGAGIWFLKRRE